MQLEIAEASSTSKAPSIPETIGAKQKLKSEISVSSPATLEEYVEYVKKKGKALYDKVYYGDIFAPTGSFQLSYARLLELLSKRKVKRLILLADGRAAIAEIPVENTESDFTTICYDRRDPNIQYAEEVPEWRMEKNRYYVELPGDVWEEGTLLDMIKENQERRVWMNGELRIPYENLLKLNEVRPELQVMDPNDAYVWLNQYSTQFLPIAGLLVLRTIVSGGDWLLKKFGKKKKSKEEELAEELGRHRATAFNVDEETSTGKKKKGTKKDTGVRYEDVAGIDHVKDDIRVILDILLGDPAYSEMGAHPVRGVLLEGPPGTGKTLLAKAMAGESGIPFYSANGAEFVEMFQGIAAARIRSLFRAARKNSPAIIFIDEIDAIGKARSDDPVDSGSAEREQGLLQLLTEMDGFIQDDRVLVVAATNLASALDEALLRPGRFDRVIHMGRPSPSNRLKILKVHAKDKPIDHSNDDALLKQISELTIGYSGAELANLLNEAAILAVRRDSSSIDFPILKEAMEKIRLGLPHASLPDSEAKYRFATVEAARAVAFALTPGLPPLEHVTILPRGGAQARILFVPQEPREDGGTWHLLRAEGAQINSVVIDKPLSPFQLACALLTPLYVPRCAEEIIFGPDSISLLTSKEMSRAGELARWIVVDSKLHPRNRDSSVLTNMSMGGEDDPTTAWKHTEYDEDIRLLQETAFAAARRLVTERKSVIETVAKELCENKDETVLGSRIIELLKTNTIDDILWTKKDVEESWRKLCKEDWPSSEGIGDELGEEILESEEYHELLEILMGRVEEWDLVPGKAKLKAKQVREQLLDPETRKRVEEMAAFAKNVHPGMKGWPSPPTDIPDHDQGVELERWMSPAKEQETIIL